MEKAFYEIEDNFNSIYKTAIALLNNRGFNDMVNVISKAQISILNTDYDRWNNGTYTYTIYLSLSVKLYSRLTKTQIEEIEKLLSETLSEVIKGDENNFFIVQINPVLLKTDTDWELIGGREGRERLKSNIETIRNIMVSVATNGSRIQDEDNRYKMLNKEIKENLSKLNLKYANNFIGLWDWYGKWRADFPTYQERRNYINDLFAPIFEYLDVNNDNQSNETLVELNDWEKIQRIVIKIKRDGEVAKNTEDFQSVGLCCREVIIALAQEVYNPDIHGTIDATGVMIGKSDAVRMFDNYFKKELSGSSNEELRSYAKSTNKLANMLTHKNTATKKDMLLATSATLALINFIGVIAGKY